MESESVKDPAMLYVLVPAVNVPENPVKFKSRTQLLFVMATIESDAPAATNTFGAVATEPSVVPITMVLVTPLAAAPVSLNATNPATIFSGFQNISLPQNPISANLPVVRLAADLTIGAGSHQLNESFRGYLNDLRITKGVARYSGNTISVPTGPFLGAPE